MLSNLSVIDRSWPTVSKLAGSPTVPVVQLSDSSNPRISILQMSEIADTRGSSNLAVDSTVGHVGRYSSNLAVGRWSMDVAPSDGGSDGCILSDCITYLGIQQISHMNMYHSLLYFPDL